MLLDRLNRWTATRLKTLREERFGRIAVNKAGLIVQRAGQSREVAWNEVERIIATKKSAYIGDVIGLAVFAHSQEVAYVSEHDPEWQNLIAGLADHLPGCLPYARWSVELIASANEQVQVFDQNSDPDLNEKVSDAELSHNVRKT